MTLLSSSAMLAPFRVRSFRFQFPADLATSWGIEMENLVLGWYVLVETGSVVALTLYWALQYLGTLLALSGSLRPFVVFIVGALSGLVRPCDQGMRNALVAATMPADRLMATMG